jgi:hypothetical protein
MNIYIAHSTSFDYESQLYKIIRKNPISLGVRFILPHETKNSFVNSKIILKSVNCMVAEISRPSTGLGIEMGWADMLKVPIIAICKKGFRPSDSSKKIAKKVYFYSDSKSLQKVLAKIIKVSR